MFLTRSIRQTPKMRESRRENARLAGGSWSLDTVWLEERVLLSSGPPNPSANAPLVLPASVMSRAVALGLGTAVSGEIAAGAALFYEVAPSSDGRLIAQALTDPAALDVRLALYDGQGNLLVESDGQSAGRQNPAIDQHVAAGNDFIEVQGLSGSGGYTLSTSLTPSSDPGQTVVLPPDYLDYFDTPIAVGDFTNNGILDIVAPDGVHLGTGDGTFEAPAASAALDNPAAADEPSALAVGDFNGDGNLDVAMATFATDSISIFMGNGDGTFQPATTIGLPVGSGPAAIVAGDFLGNGKIDLAVADTGLDNVTILLGNGDGTFQELAPITVGLGPVSIAAGDFEDNGMIDLAVADSQSGDVDILSNQGGGNFVALPSIELPARAAPTAITAGDFGTGQVDLAVTDPSQSAVYILRGHGDGTFTQTGTYAVGTNPYSIVAGDFGNGHVDLAVANEDTDNVSVLVGNGNGTFQGAVAYAAGTGPDDVALGAFTASGRLDLAVGNVYSNDISVLLGKGNGSFEESADNVVGSATVAEATGDFTGNGNLGLAVLNRASNTITILPGNGDGTFQQTLTVNVPTAGDATAIVAADFNGDGRTDLAVADPDLNEVFILLGNGDGTFEVLPPITVNTGPYALVAGDFTGNGKIDLAVADNSSSTVTILLGNGDGTFDEEPPIPLASSSSYPIAIAAGYFTKSGHLDLAVADRFTDDVTVLLGDGTGKFQPQAPISLGGNFPSALSLVAGDFSDNGLTDLAVASFSLFGGNDLDVLMANGDGTFQAPDIMAVSPSPTALVAGDFTGNGIIDLATADENSPGTDDYSIYLGSGDGTFQAPISYGLDATGGPTDLVAGDFTGTGRTDLAISLDGPDDVQVELSNGDGTFSPPSVVDLVRRETPVVADLNGDHTPDVTVVDAAGDILFRAGRPGEPGDFAPPVTVNPGDPSRDVTVVTTEFGPTIASVDADDNAISFFVARASGFVMVGKLATGSEPAQILSADLDANLITDLIVRNAGNGTISVYDGDGSGWFLPPVTLTVGLGASDVAVAALGQNGLLDIVYTNRIAGEVGVLENLGSGTFGSPVLYQAGRGPYGMPAGPGPSAVTSLEGTTSVAAGIFTPGGLTSLVALNPGSNTFGFLAGLPGGELANPTLTSTPASGLVVRAVDFDGDGSSGIAVLTSDGLDIYVDSPERGFVLAGEYDVGFEPNGLTVADLTGTGKADLLVSNPLGDVQVLIGNGNGTFQPVENSNQQVGLAVFAPSGSTPAAFIFTDQLTDQLIVKTAGGATTILGDASTGLISPGAVELADLNDDGVPYLIVANSGSNNVLVYPELGNGTFGQALNDGHGFYTGTDPVGITVANLNGRPDLIVANQGSNDVSILLNVKVGDSFTFVAGPRLETGIGPVSTVVANVLDGAFPDLLVANSGSNTVSVLPGLGNGFFNDQDPTTFAVGTNPTALFVGQFSTGPGQDLVTVNSGSNSLTEITGLGSASPQMQTVSSGGVDPFAAFQVGVAGLGQDLVVANNGDGNIALFQPGENGLALSSVLAASGLPNPSGLALASFGGGNLEFYASTDGEASASLLGFNLETAEASSGLSTSEAGGSAQVLSLSESSLALIGSLLTISLEATYDASEGSDAEAASAGPGAAGQSLLTSLRSSEGPDVLLQDPTAEPGALAQPELSWARYVMGLDQAIESIRAEADARLLQEAQPAQAPEPGTTLFEEDAAPAPAVTTSFVDQPGARRGGWLDADDGRLDAIDLTIGSWVVKEPTTSESIYPMLPDKTLRNYPARPARHIEVTDRANLFSGGDIDQAGPLEIQVSRAITLVAVSAIAVKARQRGKRPGFISR